MTSKLAEGAPRPAKDRSGNVQAVERALTLLQLLGGSADGFRLTELVKQTGMSPSTVHRLLTTLETRRFVEYDQGEKLWHVGQQSFAVGSAFLRRHDITGPALPHLRRLRDITRETASFGVIEQGDVVVIAHAESREVRELRSFLGSRTPLARSGAAKAIIATYPSWETAANDTGEPVYSLNMASSLRSELREIRRRGYAIETGAIMRNRRCVASPVFDEWGEVSGAVSVTAVAMRLADERLDSIGELVHTAAKNLTAALGGQVPVFSD